MGTVRSKFSFQADRIMPNSREGGGWDVTQQWAAQRRPLDLLRPWFGSSVSTVVLELLTLVLFGCSSSVVAPASGPCCRK